MDEPFKLKKNPVDVEQETALGDVTRQPTSPFSRTSTLSKRGRMSFLLKRAKQTLTSKDSERNRPSDSYNRDQPSEEVVSAVPSNEQLGTFLPPVNGTTTTEHRHSFYSQTTDSDSFRRSSDAQVIQIFPNLSLSKIITI